MPKDDWVKYARRDRGRKALATGEYDRVERTQRKRRKNNRKKGPAKHRRQNGMYRVRKKGFATVDYPGWPPESCQIRYVVSHDGSLPIPPWPGFT